MSGIFRSRRVPGLREHFHRIHLGHGIGNKLKFIGIAIFQSIKPITKWSPSLCKTIEEVKKKLWKDVVIEINGIKYALLDPESFVIVSESESFMSMWWELKKGEVLVDIGAHIGKYTLTMAKLVENEGAVVAIEPNPANYKALQKNIKLNNIKNVIAVNLAAWDEDCALKLFTGHVAGHHSVKIDWKLGWYETKAMPVDRILKKHCIGRVDWIKIDVEGAECEVLYGLKETINKCKPRIIVEASSENIGKIRRFLEEHGYSLIKISPLFESKIYGVFRKLIYFYCLPFIFQP